MIEVNVKLYTMKDAAKLLGIDYMIFWRKIRKGELPEPQRKGGSRGAALRRSYYSNEDIETLKALLK